MSDGEAINKYICGLKNNIPKEYEIRATNFSNFNRNKVKGPSSMDLSIIQETKPILGNDDTYFDLNKALDKDDIDKFVAFTRQLKPSRKKL